MKQFLQYVYTGKIKTDLKTIINLVRISSYYGNDVLIDSVKSLLESD